MFNTNSDDRWKLCENFTKANIIKQNTRNETSHIFHKTSLNSGVPVYRLPDFLSDEKSPRCTPWTVREEKKVEAGRLQNHTAMATKFHCNEVECIFYINLYIHVFTYIERASFCCLLIYVYVYYIYIKYIICIYRMFVTSRFEDPQEIGIYNV